MREFYIKITWRNKGTGYERSECLYVEASTLRAAVSKALSPAYCKKRIGWRVPDSAVVYITVIAGKREGKNG